jgi:hypothetical protein
MSSSDTSCVVNDNTSLRMYSRSTKCYRLNIRPERVPAAEIVVEEGTWHATQRLHRRFEALAADVELDAALLRLCASACMASISRCSSARSLATSVSPLARSLATSVRAASNCVRVVATMSITQVSRLAQQRVEQYVGVLSRL